MRREEEREWENNLRKSSGKSKKKTAFFTVQ
jgi:hypothetical protein